MSVEMTAKSASAESPEDVFERQAILAGSVTLMAVVFAACIGFHIDFVEPMYEKYTRSVEFANVNVLYGVFVLSIGAACIGIAISAAKLCVNDED